MQKTYVSADQLLRDSYELGLRVAASGWRPDLVVGIWRGGTPVAIAVQEVLAFTGIACDHIAIRTSSYTGINQNTKVEVWGLEYLVDNLAVDAKVLLVDDVLDTGLSLDKVVTELADLCAPNPPEIRTAVPWFKPRRNRTKRAPDYHLHTTDDWLVFPHELQGLDDDELRAKPGIKELTSLLLQVRDRLRNE